MANTMTYVTALSYAIENINDDTVVERLTALKEQLEKRNSRERKPSKNQLANENLKADILSFINESKTSVRAMDVAENFGVSGQKASALLKQLVDSKSIDKYSEKRVTYFKAVEG